MGTLIRKHRRPALLFALIALAAILGLPPLLSWQRMGQQRALSLSNMRRLGNSVLLYTQDWDGRPPAPALRRSDGSWQTWPQILRGYVPRPADFSNPSNPISPFHSDVRHPTAGYPIDTSYALNRRLWDTFGPGPFPLENLEMPEQTALLVEAGPMWQSPRQPPSTRHPIAVLDYGDMTDRYGALYPYPSPHDGRMIVVAADGHGILVTVNHYRTADGPHDTLYGRIGDSLYNWNGGHPNGDTDKPPRE